MAEISTEKDLLDSDVGLSGGNQTITVTTEAPSLNLTESEQSNEVIYSVGEFDIEFNNATKECRLIGRGSMTASHINLESEYSGHTLVEIADNAFAYDETLKSISIPASVRKIGSWAFRYCTSLTQVTLEDTNELYNEDLIISVGAFNMCQFEEINIPSRVIELQNGAFTGCTKCKTLTFSDNSRLAQIGNTAFQMCKMLESIELPSSITKIGLNIFDGCENLNNVSFMDIYTWFVSNDSSLNSEGMQLIRPEFLYANTDSKAKQFLTQKAENGGYADYYWYKLKQMLSPIISIGGSILSMTDPLGVAEEFNIYVNGQKRATVYPSASGSAAAAAEPVAASLDEGEGETPIEETETTGGEVEA